MLIARHAVATLAALATATLGSITVIAPGAQAADSRAVTDYGFKGRAFGSVAKAEPLAVGSGPSAPARLGCTREAGIRRANHVAETGGQVGSALHVTGVDNTASSYRSKRNVGSRSTSTIARAVLGDPNGSHLTITGLRTVTHAFAKREDGTMHARSSATSAGISGETGTPLDDVLDPAGATLQDLLEALAEESGGTLEVPGLGKLKLGSTHNRVRRGHATSAASALRGTLYGQDSVSGGGDDVRFVLGKSQSVIYEDMRSGVFSGRAVPLEASLLGDLVDLGRIQDRPLPCPGTDGVVRESAVVGGDLGGLDQLVLGQVSTRVFGLQREDRSATAWTSSRASDLFVANEEHEITIKDAQGRANVATNAKGQVTRKTKRGSGVGAVVVDGETQEPPRPGDVIEVPGLAKLEFFLVDRATRGLQVTAVRISLLDGTETDSVINLGQARTYIKRS